MDKYYSKFWLQYCNDKIELNSEFAERDIAYFEESLEFYNISGRVITTETTEYVIHGNAVCGIEGHRV